jgi:hypothetical protein
MDPRQFTTMANKFQSVLDEEVLNERGQALGWVKRKRLVAPFRMGLSVIASMATQHVQTIADLHRQFNELWDLDTEFDTEKETISEALIWASLAASSLKRFLAHAAEHLLEVVISTRKAAMPSAYALPDLFRALRDGDGPWYRRAFSAMRHYLGRNAKRAHPKRDARTGRTRLGLKSVFQLSEDQVLIDSSEEPVAA